MVQILHRHKYYKYYMYTGMYTIPLVNILYILQILHWYKYYNYYRYRTHTTDTYINNDLIVESKTKEKIQHDGKVNNMFYKENMK